VNELCGLLSTLWWWIQCNMTSQHGHELLLQIGGSRERRGKSGDVELGS
jgi:hypothetical protein